LVVVVLFCLLLFGPACWLSSHDFLPPGTVSTMYRPILVFAPDGTVLGLVGWYACVGAREGEYLEVENGLLLWER